MKFLTFASFFLLMFSSVSFGQSYWFGGMTRIPGGVQGSVGSFVIGGQSNSMESKMNISENVSGTLTEINRLHHQFLGISDKEPKPLEG